MGFTLSISYNKKIPYRSKKILQAAKDCPCCMSCGKMNDGTIVMAHSNQQRDGKGMGIKAHDYRVAAVCSACHDEIDGRRKGIIVGDILWEFAHRATIGWLFDAGIIK